MLMRLNEKRIFVIGTDMRAGKTFVCVKLLEMLKKNGLNPGYFKPVSTRGVFKDNQLVSEDVLLIRNKTGLSDPFESMCPQVYEVQAPPLIAAELSGKPVSLTKIRGAFEALCRKYESFVVEGIGGVLEPLSPSYLVIDLIREFSLPVVVVAKAEAGILNQVALTVRALKASGLKVAGIAMSYTSGLDTGLSVGPSIDFIEKITGVPFLEKFNHEMDWK